MTTSGDIGPAMEIIAKAIPTIAYNAKIPVASFRYKDWRVILNKNEILIKDINEEADAVEVIKYLKDIVDRG